MRFRIGMSVRKNGSVMPFCNKLVEMELETDSLGEARLIAKKKMEDAGYYVQRIFAEHNITGI